MGAVKPMKPPFEAIGSELGVSSWATLPMFLRFIEAKLNVLVSLEEGFRDAEGFV